MNTNPRHPLSSTLRIFTALVSSVPCAAGAPPHATHSLSQPNEATVSQRSSSNEYKLVWADEFERDGPPSEDNWKFETGFVRNQEAQWYQRQNAICKDGLLVIEARRERIPVDPDSTGRRLERWASGLTHADYTSSSLHTRGKHEWRYGRFVMRARIPAVQGSWPAFWTLGHGRWPACGEIDVMEYYDDSILANVAWLGRNGIVWDAKKTPVHRIGDTTWANDFHEWRMEWDVNSIRLYVDDRLLNTTDITRLENAKEGSQNPFHKPHYLLVNLAIGGKHGGDPTDTVFPIRYEVDYVRVYQDTTRDGELKLQ